MILLTIILIVILIESAYSPRLEWTREKELLLFYNNNEKKRRDHYKIY